MKKISLIAMLAVLATGGAMAQSLQVSGHIKDESGAAVPSALVQVSDTHAATYTDSTGYFVIPATAKAMITVVAKGYSDEVVAPKKEITVILKKGKSSGQEYSLNDPNKVVASTKPNNTYGTTYFQLRGTDRNLGGSGMMFNISRKENTQGSRYLVGDGWAPGYVVEANGNTVKNDNYNYNYDKINGNLLLTQDKRAAVEVERRQVKSFTIINNGVPQTFEVVPAIDSTHFSEVLVKGNQYSIFKKIKTTFVKSNYRTDGMTSSGNNYDEYVDEPAYFVKNEKTGAVQKMALKAKSLKTAFAADADKVKKFMSENDGDIDENYIKGLGEALNK